MLDQTSTRAKNAFAPDHAKPLPADRAPLGVRGDRLQLASEDELDRITSRAERAANLLVPREEADDELPAGAFVGLGDPLRPPRARRQVLPPRRVEYVDGFEPAAGGIAAALRDAAKNRLGFAAPVTARGVRVEDAQPAEVILHFTTGISTEFGIPGIDDGIPSDLVQTTTVRVPAVEVEREPMFVTLRCVYAGGVTHWSVPGQHTVIKNAETQ